MIVRARVVRLHRDWEAITVSEQREACGTGDGVSQVVVAAGTVVDGIFAGTVRAPVRGM